MSDIIIGDQILSNVKAIAVKDIEGGTIQFTSPDVINHLPYLGVVPADYSNFNSTSYNRCAANTKYYISNDNYNQYGIYNRFVLIAFPYYTSTPSKSIDIVTLEDYKVLNEGDIITGTLVWRNITSTAAWYTSGVDTLTLGCDSTGPYFKFSVATEVYSSYDYSMAPLEIKIGDLYYGIFVELGGTIINRNKSPIPYHSKTSMSDSHPYFTQTTGVQNVSEARDYYVDAFNRDDDVTPTVMWFNTILNEEGTWHCLMHVDFDKGSNSANAYFNFASYSAWGGFPNFTWWKF